MKTFVRKGLLFAMLVLLPYLTIQYLIITRYDQNYPKLTGKHESVIAGMSRAKTGISPQTLSNELGLPKTPQNIAFSISATPYGSYYYAYLKKKVIAGDHDNNIHLLTVSPASIMDMIGRKESQELYTQLHSVTANPNIEYLFKKVSLKLLNARLNLSKESQMLIHKNGWVEMNFPKNYLKNMKVLNRTYTPNKERIEYLKKTIDLLSKTGDVFIIRMPISSEILKEEQKLFPDFDQLIEKIASESSTPYLNYTQQTGRYEFIDNPGHHLTGKSAREFTRNVAQDIKDLLPGH